MHVQIAADVSRVDQRRQLTPLGRDDLILALAKFRRNVGEIEQAIEGLFIGH